MFVLQRYRQDQLLNFHFIFILVNFFIDKLMIKTHMYANSREDFFGA